MYSNLVVIKSSQKHAICTQVNYRILNDVRMSSENYYWKVNPHGELVITNGSIFQPQLKQPGLLKLKLNTLPYPTPYVVIKLGPLINNQYAYSIVTDDDHASLYVYARSVQNFHTKYDEDILKFCEANGFSSYYNKPVKTPQPTPCAHPIQSNVKSMKHQD